MDETLTRILELMKKENMTETEMQELIGVPKGSFSNWKRNQGHAFYKYIDIIADRLGVTIDYLIRGHETADGAMTKQEMDLLDNYRRLTPRGKKLISENIGMILGGQCKTKFEGRTWDGLGNDEKPTL